MLVRNLKLLLKNKPGMRHIILIPGSIDGIIPLAEAPL
jgi:hypothetical protein